MWGVFDLVSYAVSYIPSCTRNLPLMLRQFSRFARRLYGYILRSASDMRESFVQRGYMPHQAGSSGYSSFGSIPWNNPSAAFHIH
ncbi:hypothetical protein SUGI_0571830 [Cryptomeria japonica]|nr:hypothetical protein SUGI_0571830 [Cryptomeria japonica]